MSQLAPIIDSRTGKVLAVRDEKSLLSPSSHLGLMLRHQVGSVLQAHMEKEQVSQVSGL